MASFSQYLTYSDEDEKWQVICTDVGYQDVRPHMVYPPSIDAHPRQYRSVATGRTLNEYQLVYITRGTGVFESQGTTYAVHPGTMLILFPGVAHKYNPDFGVGWTEFWIGFQGRYPDVLRAGELISEERPVIDIGLRDGIVNRYRSVFEYAETQRPGYQFSMSAETMSLLADTLGYEKQGTLQSHSEVVVTEAKVTFEEHVYGNIDIDKVAADLHVSVSHLTELFKAYTGMPPYQYFLHLKINKAKEMITTEKTSVKEVAYRLGFENQYYFSRLFKKKTGVPPSQWHV